MIAGGIIGWIVVEFVGAATKTIMPYSFHFGMVFVAGLAGYSLAV